MSDRPLQTILFLCTGNYYRSRFAEILFNTLSSEQRLGWTAESRGIRLTPQNSGPLSAHTSLALAQLGIQIDQDPRDPIQVSARDFERAHRIVALKEAEHRPLLRQDFPRWEDRVEYWHIHDVDCQKPRDALPELERLVRALVVELANGDGPRRG